MATPARPDTPGPRVYYAHTATDKDGNPTDKTHWQLLTSTDPDRPGHLESVETLAADFASAFGAAEWARLAGRWHDLGKFSDAFQNYLENAADSDADGETDAATGRARGPDHSTAGAQHAALAHSLLGPLLAYLIAGHHAGLPNGRDQQPSALDARLAKVIEPYAEAARAAGCFAAPTPFPTPPGWAFTSGYALGFLKPGTIAMLPSA